MVLSFSAFDCFEAMDDGVICGLPVVDAVVGVGVDEAWVEDRVE